MKILDSQFESLLLGGATWIDVRAPIEFHAGTVPGAVNLPLLSDEERHKIGLTYKQQGQEAAIQLGHTLVSGSIRESRTEAWVQEVAAHPESIIFCFRGGLRSQIVQSWLHDRGVDRPIIAGGYKALRRFFIDAIETCSQRLELLVVSGPTGSGKTNYLHASGRPFLDLEAIAAHRGSAFGAIGPQPTQVDFENSLAVELLRLAKCNAPILIEDESLRIGQRAIPEVLYQKMKISAKIQIELNFDARVENIFKNYVLDSGLANIEDTSKFDDFRRSVAAISRKLGGLRAQEINCDINAAQSEFLAGQGLAANRVWISKLLQWYYDPLYRRTWSRSS